MKTMIFVIIVLGITIALLASAKNKKLSKSKYYAKRPLTQPEQTMYWKLIKALPEYVVLAQVSFSSFIYAKGDLSKENYIKFNKIKQKRADFMICSKDFKIIAVIEVDDSSHDKEKDEKRDKALMEAGVKTIRWHVKNLPAGEEIKKTVDRLKASTPGNIEHKQQPEKNEHENNYRLPGQNQGKTRAELRLQTGQVSGADNDGNWTLPQKKKHDG